MSWCKVCHALEHHFLVCRVWACFSPSAHACTLANLSAASPPQSMGQQSALVPAASKAVLVGGCCVCARTTEHSPNSRGALAALIPGSAEQCWSKHTLGSVWLSYRGLWFVELDLCSDEGRAEGIEESDQHGVSGVTTYKLAPFSKPILPMRKTNSFPTLIRLNWQCGNSPSS